jgi:hypothetical protein
MNMNADPLEHAKPAVILVGLFYRNLLELVNGVSEMTPLPHDEHASLDKPLFLSDHHGRYPVYDTHFKRLCRGQISI